MSTFVSINSNENTIIESNDYYFIRSLLMDYNSICFNCLNNQKFDDLECHSADYCKKSLNYDIFKKKRHNIFEIINTNQLIDCEEICINCSFSHNVCKNANKFIQCGFKYTILDFLTLIYLYDEKNIIKNTNIQKHKTRRHMLNYLKNMCRISSISNFKCLQMTKEIIIFELKLKELISENFKYPFDYIEYLNDSDSII